MSHITERERYTGSALMKSIFETQGPPITFVFNTSRTQGTHWVGLTFVPRERYVGYFNPLHGSDGNRDTIRGLVAECACKAGADWTLDWDMCPVREWLQNDIGLVLDPHESQE